MHSVTAAQICYKDGTPQTQSLSTLVFIHVFVTYHTGHTQMAFLHMTKYIPAKPLHNQEIVSLHFLLGI